MIRTLGHTFFLLAFAWPLAAFAQDGVIGGVVTNEDGLAVAGVSVTATGAGLGTEARTALTSARGRYGLGGLPAGTYTLRFVYPGFAIGTRAGVVVGTGARTVVDMQLVSLRTATLAELQAVVTGTHFAAPPIGLPYAVDVASRESIEEQGSPLTVDLFKRLGANHGTMGERSSWYNRSGTLVPETVASVNLRGLGPSRTLVLLNGRRQVYTPSRLPGGRFVDVNSFPTIALDRVEVLKEGASAIYGSDAVAGVANFVTRRDFEGFEITAAHDYYSGAGDSNAGAIWGGRLGASTNVVLSAEWAARQALLPEQRDWALRPYPGPGGGGWSYYGNPGAFLMPSLTGSETPGEFVNALIDSQFGPSPSLFLDPACEDFGGSDAGASCRFRYQPWDNLIEAQTHVRAFGELNSELGVGTTMRVEGLWSEATIPEWLTTPSYPPISLYDGVQVVLPENPGRQAFCAANPGAAGFGSAADCLQDDWYFFGRLVGNSGPGRALRRASRTQRVAASLDRHFESFGGGDGHLDISASYSRATGNVNQPAEYAYRKYLAWRGFGGPNCGVGVVVDPSSAAGMSLGDTGGAVAGQGDCMFYNPFSNALPRSGQPGSRYFAAENPGYVAGAANSPELIAWINEEVDLFNTADLFVGEATLTGSAIGDVVDFALGYQFRRFDVTGTPNDPGNQALNPCYVPGDRACLEQAGQFTFTTGYFPYEDAQTVHRFYGEVPLSVGGRFDVQVAANYEFHDVASSFDPKFAARWNAVESDEVQLSLRGSLQSTFRVPSVDDVNTDKVTALEYVQEVDVYKAVDAYGSTDLVPERAVTGNVGLIAFHFPTRTEATFDFWTYDFKDIINVIPSASVTRLYNEGGSSRAAVRELIKCPDGWGTGTCDAALLERIRIHLINWPGMQTSGFDWSLATRRTLGNGEVSLGLDGTYTRTYNIDALDFNGVELQAATEGAGVLNRNHPIAWPLPQWKWSASLGYHADRFSVIGNLHYISSYDDPDSVDPNYRVIDAFATLDATFLMRVTDGIDAFVTGFNLLGTPPPLVNQEASYDGLTHDPKGRRLKAGMTYTIN